MEAEELRRVVVAAVLVLVAMLVAKLVDRALMRRLDLPPERLTRYRVLRRSITATIVAVGALSALLVVPEVRAAAGGILASSAVVGLVVGLAARTTIANFVGGILIAFTQPVRLGDEVDVAGAQGAVEEIGLTYTTIRTAAGARVFVPNERLASETIRNATAGVDERLAEVSVPVPLASDLDRVLEALEDEARSAVPTDTKRVSATVSHLDAAGPSAVVAVSAWIPRGQAAGAEATLRLAVHRRLRAEGML